MSIAPSDIAAVTVIHTFCYPKVTWHRSVWVSHGLACVETGILNIAIFGWQIEPSCDQTFRIGLDLSCSSSRGLNFDDFPFFYFLERTSGSQVMPNLRLVKNWEICWKIVIIIIGIMQYTVVHWTSFSFLTNLELGITRLPEVRSRK